MYIRAAAYTAPTDMLVGGVACRYERGEGGACRLYVMSLGVLAPYRGRGVGQRLLVRALTEAQREGSASDAYLHVQVRSKARPKKRETLRRLSAVFCAGAHAAGEQRRRHRLLQEVRLRGASALTAGSASACHSARSAAPSFIARQPSAAIAGP
jgi:hypothetical protein